MKVLLEKLFARHTLAFEEARSLVKDLAGGTLPAVQVGAILSVFRMRPLRVDELDGFRAGLLELALPVKLDHQVLDIVGTGGDGKNTFNISTLSAFVVAAAGRKVAKHGNYGVSSACGSSNVLEALGVRFSADGAQLKKEIAEAGICFLHAPLFHPALKALAPLRKELGVKTFFNLLGPLINPANPGTRVLGVYSYELLRLYGYVLQRQPGNFLVLHSLCGYDEVSLTGPCKLMSQHEEKVLEPEDFGCARVDPQAISGGNSIAEAAAIFRRVMEGKGTEAQMSVVSANAGLALHTADPKRAIADCVGEARELLNSGKVAAVLERLLKVQNAK